MLQSFDWSAPWLGPYQNVGHPTMCATLAQGTVCAGLNIVPTETMAFVPQSNLPPGTAYEQFIFDTHRVPTRDNLHDFFNGLV